MKSVLSRRMLALAVALCLTSALSSAAFASPDPEPPARTTGDAVQLAPATTGPAAEVTTGPANGVTLDTVENEPWPTLTLEFNEGDRTPAPSDRPNVEPPNSNMKAKLEEALVAEGKTLGDWDEVTRLVVTGTATEITACDWAYLRNMCFVRKIGNVTYGGENNQLRELDLSRMENLKTIKSNFSVKPNFSSIGITTNGSDLVYLPTSPSTLRTVKLPDSLTSIGVNAFAGCAAMALDQFPSELTSIGENAFSCCMALTRPEGLSGGKSLTIPASVTEIGDSAFEYCLTLTEITLPESLSSISYSTFSNCALLKTVNLPESLEEIMASAFSNCVQLKQIKLPGKLTTIKANTFMGAGLKSIVLPETMERIDETAFGYCENLESVSVPQSVTEIRAGAFTGCPELKFVFFEGDSPALKTWNLSSDPSTAPPPGTLTDVFPDSWGQIPNPNTLFFVPSDAQGYDSSAWAPAADSQVIRYSPTAEPGLIQGLKPAKDGALPAYEVWDTLEFSTLPAELPVFTGDPATDPPRGACYADKPTGWTLYYLPDLHTFPSQGSPLPPLPPLSDASALSGDPLAPSRRQVIAAGDWGEDGPFSAVVYPSQRPAGVYALDIKCMRRISTGSAFIELPYGTGNFHQYLEFLPPPTPAEASWLLTVQNGTGSGYYEAEHSAPVVAKLKAAPPAPGAKFLRWELKAGTGTFADANSPETRFTMAVGDSTVEAVFETAGPVNPTQPPAPTLSPPTGDPGLPGAAALLLLAAGVSLGWAKSLRRAKAPAKRRGQ